MTIKRDIEIRQGERAVILLAATGLATSGRGLRCHIRDYPGAPTVRAVLTYNGAANLSVSFAAGGILLDIGATITRAFDLSGQKLARWSYSVENFSLTDDDDVIHEFAGVAIVHADPTDESSTEAAPGHPSGDDRYVRFDGEQDLSDEQKLQAQQNMGVSAGGGGGVTVHNDLTGRDAVNAHPNAGAAAGFMSAADKTKLDGVATGATANSTDAQLRARADHTGTQLANTISNFNAAAAAAAPVQSVAGRTGAIVIVVGDVGGAEATANKAQPSGYASLDSGGKLPQAQLPNIAINEFLGEVASQVAMLALSGQKGDWCNRTDTNVTWFITGTDPTLLGSWTAIVYPAGSSHNHAASEITSGTLDAARLPTATDTTQGAVELATLAEAVTGTATNRAVTPEGSAAVIAAHAAAADAHAIAGVNGLTAALAAKAPLASPALSGTPTAPTASANTNSTQIATTAYADAAVAAAVAGLLDFKGDTDASGNPNYPAASKGDSYAISVAGKVGGASGKSVDIGDMIVAKADNAGGTEASVGTSWFVLEHNLVGALLTSQIGVDVQAYSAVLAATTASFTTADETKLDGIEALADVTDAGNVGSSIHGSSAKTTPVDADTMPLIDSAASNALKKVTWSSIKATLLAYFDTVYAAISHNHSGANITSGTVDAARLPTASDTASGVVELATTAEATTGSDTTRAVTCAGVKAVGDLKLPLAGGTISGTLAMTDQQITRPRLTDYAITHNALGNRNSATTIDCELGNYVSATVTGSFTFTFSNPPASANAGGFILELINGGSATVTWPGSVSWPGGVAPTLTAAGTDLLVFVTRDGGTTWRGAVSGLDY